MIHLDNIHVTFAKKTPLENHVLRGITMSVIEHEFITVIGGNGAGKSTLMNVLSGDILPDNGSIHIQQKDITLSPTQQRAALVSRVFQDPLMGSCAELTIEENLLLAYKRGHCRTLRLAKKPELRSLLQEKLSTLGIGLENRLATPIGALSGGQRQAVSLLMATLQPCKLLLLDEHTAALDPKMAATILELTNQLVKANKITTIMITHSMHHALKYGDRTIVMQQGKVVADVSGEARSRLQPADLYKYFDES